MWFPWIASFLFSLFQALSLEDLRLLMCDDVWNRFGWRELKAEGGARLPTQYRTFPTSKSEMRFYEMKEIDSNTIWILNNCNSELAFDLLWFLMKMKVGPLTFTLS